MKERIKARAAKFIALLLTAALLLNLNACLPYLFYDLLKPQQEEGPISQQLVLPEYETNGEFNNYSFDMICDLLFENEVTCDSLTLNQCVADPEELGITVPRPATLGEYTLKATQKDNQLYSEILEALANSPLISYERLSPQQQREFTYIESILKLTLYFEDFYYYDEPLRPSTGAQAMLPLTLMDYSIRTVDDIDIYLEVLEDFPRYFDQLIAHEKEKKDKGLLMASEAMQDSIDEATAYTGAADTHILAKSFDELLDRAVENALAADETSDLAALTPEEIKDYKERDVKALGDCVIPTYENLISELTSLYPETSSGIRLYDYPRGTDYYALTMELMGFDESPSEAINTLERSLDENWEILMSDFNAYYLGDAVLQDAVNRIGEDPEDFIEYVRAHSGAEFAAIEELEYKVKLAPDASPNDYAMAYFLIPPVDNPQQNTIVFFPRNISDEVELYSTVAHEAYPGHMYHFFTYAMEEPSNISKLLGSSAFIEGWAMYSQTFAMEYLNVTRNYADAYNAYDRFAYNLQARVDLGINFEGWTVNDAARYLSEWGFDGAAEAIYDTSIKQPVAYLPYGLGLIKFRDHRIEAEQVLGANFNPVAYHQMLMSIGPLPFDMLDKEIATWLQEQNRSI